MALKIRKPFSCWKFFFLFVLGAVFFGLFLFARQIAIYYFAIKSGKTNLTLEQSLDSSFSSMIANKHVSASDLLALSQGTAGNMGRRGAALSIVEFADYSCPYSQRSASAVRKVMEAFGGSVSFQMRDFPIADVHPRAMRQALAARCAGAQGKYWAYHDVLFAHQDQQTDEDFLQFASRLGLKTDVFQSCLDRQTFAGDIQQDLSDGLRVGVEGTPTFFFNGIKIQGALDEAALSLIINQFLKQKKS